MRCELEVGDSHNFPQIPVPEWCNFFSQNRAGSLTELPETLERRACPSRFFYQFHPGFYPIVSRSHGAVRDLLSNRFPRLHHISAPGVEFTCKHARAPPSIALITRISHRFHQEFMSPVGSSAYLGVNLVRYIWPLTSSVTPANRHSKPPRPQWPKSTADTYFRFGRLCPEGDGRAKWPRGRIPSITFTFRAAHSLSPPAQFYPDPGCLLSLFRPSAA